MDQLEQSVADRILVLQRARARAVSSRDKAEVCPGLGAWFRETGGCGSPCPDA